MHWQRNVPRHVRVTVRYRRGWSDKVRPSAPILFLPMPRAAAYSPTTASCPTSATPSPLYPAPTMAFEREYCTATGLLQSLCRFRTPNSARLRSLLVLFTLPFFAGKSCSARRNQRPHFSANRLDEEFRRRSGANMIANATLIGCCKMPPPVGGNVGLFNNAASGAVAPRVFASQLILFCSVGYQRCIHLNRLSSAASSVSTRCHHRRS